MSTVASPPNDPIPLPFSNIEIGTRFTIPYSSHPDRVYEKVAADRNINAREGESRYFTVTPETMVLLVV
jgi:hypothetical protein